MIAFPSNVGSLFELKNIKLYESEQNVVKEIVTVDVLFLRRDSERFISPSFLLPHTVLQVV